MRLNRAQQYAFLFSVYICRAGRATLRDASANLGLSKSFLEQVANKLRKAGVVNSIRGAAGGYEFVGNPTIRQVLQAASPVSLLTPEDALTYQTGPAEFRTFAAFVKNFSASMNPILNRTVMNVTNELVANEMATLNRASEKDAH